MTFEEFMNKLHAAGFAVSKAQTEKQLRIFVAALDDVRKAGGRVKIPGFAVLKSKSTPARTVKIGGVERHVPARQRFVFTPAKVATLLGPSISKHSMDANPG